MTAINTTIALPLFKEVYGDNVENLVPAAARLQKDAKFVARDKQEGNKYHQPVKTTRSHGWTLSTSGDAFPLNAAEPARTADAQVQGSSFVLREVISYDAAAKLLSGKSEGARKRAFVSGSAYMVENMTETAAFVLETQLLYGQSDVGIVEARTAGVGTTTQTFSFTPGTFIPALWSGMENGYVEVWNAAGAIKRNIAGTMQVTGVNVDLRTVTFVGTAAEMDTIIGTDVIYLRDTKSAGMVGLRSIASNTGLMFAINAANVSLWAGNTFSAAGGSLSFVKVLQGLNKPVNRGLMKDVIGYCSPKSWSDCMNDLAALRRYSDNAGGSLEQGAESIKFYGQSGTVEIFPHILMKPSEALFFPKAGLIRLGASELTFTPPGMADKDFFENLPDHAGYGIRNYWNQALFTPTPAQCLLINGIVNSDD